MAFAKRAAILNGKHKLKVKRVPVPNWVPGDKKAFVYVRQFRGEDAGEMRQLCADSMKSDANESALQARWCVLGVCDAKGKRLFTPDDVAALLERALIPLQRCAIEVMRINGIAVDTPRKN
jgi:hypothetical protein